MDASEQFRGLGAVRRNALIAGGLLAVAALAVLVVTVMTFAVRPALTGINVVAAAWTTASAFMSGAIAWRWTAGARTLLERRVCLALSALGMTFVINAIPYVIFWGFGFLVALVAGAGWFGLPAALASGAWAWAVTAALGPGEDQPLRWSSRPGGLAFWSALGVIAMLWSIAVLAFGALSYP